jgi:integrase
MIEADVKISLRYLVEDMDRHGNVRLYVRRSGRKVRLRAEPGTPEFLAEYDAAVKGIERPEPIEAPAARDSLRWLVERYYQSAEFTQLEDSTRKVRRGQLDALCTKHGSKRFAKLEPRHVRTLRDEWNATGPEAANGRLKALRQVFAWAVEADLAEKNPARDVPYIRVATEGFHTWTIEEVAQYQTRHPIGTKARLALDLLLFTGVRRCDLVKLGRQMETSTGWIRFVETKGQKRNRKEQELPILPQLRASLDACPSGHLTYLVTEFGKPFTANGVGNWFKKRCREAGLEHCSAHGLRKAGATIAADNGATEHQLMAIYGWESPKQAARYTRKANRKRLAGDAMHLLVPSGNEQPENGSVPPSGGKSARWDNSAKKAL